MLVLFHLVLIYFILLVLGIEPRAFSMLSSHCTTEPHPQTLL